MAFESRKKGPSEIYIMGVVGHFDYNIISEESAIFLFNLNKMVDISKPPSLLCSSNNYSFS